MGIVKDIIMKSLPPSLRLPAWYGIKKIQGTLDDEIEYVKKRIAPDKCMIDIGANIGIYAYAFRNRCSLIHAFEPQPGCVKVLKALGSNRIRVHPVALSDVAGMLDLHIPVRRGSRLDGLASLRPLEGEVIVERVKVDVLDSYLFADVALLKIDVEGREMKVLGGALETIRRERPLILIEIEQRHIEMPIREIFNFIEAQGYRGGFLFRGVWHPVEEFSSEKHQRPFENELHAEQYRKVKGAYVNNFIFEPLNQDHGAAGNEEHRR